MENCPPIRTLWSRIAPAVLLWCSVGSIAAQSPIPTIERPGTLVDIGGRKMHLYCIGSGQPTVVFEPSAFQFALDWWLVQPDVGKRTRACSYDRAGLGWSDPGPHFENPEQIVTDLHTLLRAAGEKPPYVLVSMSMGAIYARAYQINYPRDVAGLVFIEPVHEDIFLVPVDGTSTPLWSLSPEQAAAFVKSSSEGPRPQPPPLSSGAPFDKLPEAVLQTRLAFERRAFEIAQKESVAEGLANFESQRATAARLHSAVNALGSLPVIVLTSERSGTSPVAEVPSKVAALSDNSTQRVVRSAHMIHLDTPSVVAQAVIDVVAGTRAKSRINP